MNQYHTLPSSPRRLLPFALLCSPLLSSPQSSSHLHDPQARPIPPVAKSLQLLPPPLVPPIISGRQLSRYMAQHTARGKASADGCRAADEVQRDSHYERCGH